MYRRAYAAGHCGPAFQVANALRAHAFWRAVGHAADPDALQHGSTVGARACRGPLPVFRVAHNHEGFVFKTPLGAPNFGGKGARPCWRQRSERQRQQRAQAHGTERPACSQLLGVCAVARAAAQMRTVLVLRSVPL